MKTDTFIHECASRGITLSITDGNLAYDAPDSAMTDDVLDYLKQHKPEIMAVLNAPAWHGGHGACVDCGVDTESMLTVPSKPWCWKCADCFEEHAAHSKNATTAIV